MRPVEFGEALAVGTRLILFSADKPDRFFRVIKFWMDETFAIALALKTGLPSYQVEGEEDRIHLLIHLPIEDREHRCLPLANESRSFDSSRFLRGVMVEGQIVMRRRETGCGNR